MESLGFIHRLRSRLRRVLVIEGLSRAVVLGIAVAAGVVTLDYLFPMPGAVRLLALVAVAVAVSALVYRRLARPLGQTMDDRTLAQLAERRLHGLEGRLLSGVEGIELSAPDRASLSAILDGQALRHMIPARVLPWYASSATALVIGVLAVALIAPVFFHAAVDRLFLPLGSADWARNTLLTGSTDRRVVPSDEPLVVDIDRVRGPSSSLHLDWAPADGSRPGAGQVLDGSGNHWRQALSLRPGLYRITATAGDSLPIILEARVVQRPALSMVHARLIPPAYTHLPVQDLSTLTCSALPGSTITFSIGFALGTDRRLEDLSATLDQKPVPLTKSPTGVSGTLSVTHGGELSIRCHDQDGITPNPEPRFAITLLEDRPPVVVLDGPRNDEAVTTHAVVGLRLDARDDYGLAGLQVFAQVEPHPATGQALPSPAAGHPPAGQEAAKERQILRFEGVSGLSVQRTAEVRIADLATLGDKLLLCAQAEDANDITGPGIGRSDPLVLRVVSDEDLRRELDRMLSDARDWVVQARDQVEHGLRSGQELPTSCRNAAPAARSAGERLDQVQRRWRENQLPEPERQVISQADGILSNAALPALAAVGGITAADRASATTADHSLAQVESLIDKLLQQGDLSRQVSLLLSQQARLNRDSRDFVRAYLTKPLDAAALVRQADLAERQHTNATQMHAIERRILGTPGGEMAKAQELVRSTQTGDRLDHAGHEIASPDQRPQALGDQTAATTTIKKLLDLLRGRDAAQGLAVQAGRLAAAQEDLNRTIRDQGATPASALAQAELAKETANLAKQVESRTQEPQAAKDLHGAASAQKEAKDHLNKGNARAAGAAGTDAASELRAAQKELQGGGDKDPDKKKKKEKPDIVALLRELATLQANLVSDSAVVVQRLGDRPLDFAGTRSVGAFATLEDGILLRLKEEAIKPLAQYPVALDALSEVAGTMKSVLAVLRSPALGTRGLRLEKLALYQLQRLIDATRSLPSKKPGGGGGGGGGQQSTPPFPPTAEFAMLATMQETVAARTAANGPGDLGAQEEHVLDLVGAIDHQVRPGTRPEILLARTRRAMTSAQYRLAHGDRGPTSRNEEDLAASTLRRLVAELAAHGGGGGGKNSQQKPQQSNSSSSAGHPAHAPTKAPSGGATAGGNSSSGQADPADVTRVAVDPTTGARIVPPPQRRSALNEARDQHLSPEAMQLYERYLDLLDDQSR